MFEIIGIAVITVTTVGGWLFTGFNNHKLKGTYEEKIRNIERSVEKLPCVHNGRYLQEIGALKNGQTANTQQLKQINDRLNNLACRLKSREPDRSRDEWEKQ